MNNIPSGRPICPSVRYCLDSEDPIPTGVVGTPDSSRRPLQASTARPNVGLMVKKVNHNATERDRRKKINSLYSSLRSLLPHTDQTKKLSIPVTISRVLKYIPELQAHIQQLTREKERLLSCSCDELQCVGNHIEERRDDPREVVAPKVVSTSWLSESEALIQICEESHSAHGLSGILLDMEINGLSLTNASSFKSSEGGKIFHDLHVRTVEGSSRSRQATQGGVYHEESSAFFGSELSRPTVKQCSNLDREPTWHACTGSS